MRWDWVVCIVGFLLCGLVGALGLWPVAIAGGYAVGRWDAEVGVKWRVK